MKVRQARKILSGNISKRMRFRLEKLYPPFIKTDGGCVYPSWHTYYRIAKAWSVVHHKIRKYGERFKPM